MSESASQRKRVGTTTTPTPTERGEKLRVYEEVELTRRRLRLRESAEMMEEVGGGGTRAATEVE